MYFRILFFMLICTVFINAQVFNTAQTLRTGKVSLGVNPTIFTDGGVNDFALYLHGGYGLKRGLDVAAKLGVGQAGGSNYFGVDVEWIFNSLFPMSSFAAGIHARNDIGLDFTFNTSYPVGRTTHIYSGLDADLVFAEETLFPLWFFGGADVIVQRNMALLFEVELGLTEEAPNIIGFGLTFYFR